MLRGLRAVDELDGVPAGVARTEIACVGARGRDRSASTRRDLSAPYGSRWNPSRRERLWSMSTC